MTCEDTCGSCAQLVYYRKCITDEATCPCSGISTKVENCNIGVCYYPRDTCCGNYTQMVIDGKHACGPQPPSPAPDPPTEYTCCPSTGFWAPWGEWSTCTGGTCGKCGTATRSRTCFSSTWNCACNGDDSETRSCRMTATWSEWTLSQDCETGSCGSCNFKTYTRTCNNDNSCVCFGDDTKYILCNPAPCDNSTQCCTGYSLTDQGNGLMICGPVPEEEGEEEMPVCGANNSTCCVMGGVWGEWSNGGACSDTCGMCGTTTRKRFCISEDWDCPCGGNDTKTSDCGGPVCLYPRNSCCDNRAKIIVNQQFYCKSADPIDPPASENCWTCCPSSGGYWSEWSTGGNCNDTCGSCAQITQYRNCLTSQYGCECKGESTQQINCNIGVCYYPRDTCCEPYVQMVIDGQHACGPQANYSSPTAPYDPYCNATCCPLNGLWSEWTLDPIQCNDYCGSCGVQTKTRTCLSEADGCPCAGASNVTNLCGIGVCYYPRLTCCPGYTQEVYEGIHACGPITNYNDSTPYINTCGVTCCPTDGIWGEWTVTMACNDTCGACGTQVRERVCLSERYGCNCTGDTSRTDICGVDVCLYPRTSCCPGFVKKINMTSKAFVCGPVPEDPVFNPAQTTCCDPEKTGLWNSWTAWTTCSATCGLCGTQSRNRTCASEAYGCPCTGDATESRACGNPVCESGSQCCTGYLATGYDGAQFCQINPPIQCPGTWTEWAAINGNVCNDTCGMCGTIVMNRYCFPSGCQCPGDFQQNQACAEEICLYPRVTCCAPYKKKISGKTFICG